MIHHYSENSCFLLHINTGFSKSSETQLHARFNRKKNQNKMKVLITCLVEREPQQGVRKKSNEKKKAAESCAVFSTYWVIIPYAFIPVFNHINSNTSQFRNEQGVLCTLFERTQSFRSIYVFAHFIYSYYDVNALWEIISSQDLFFFPTKSTHIVMI